MESPTPCHTLHPRRAAPLPPLPQILFLVELLGALRQLAHMYVPLRAMTQPQLMHWLGTLKASPVSERVGGR